MKNYSKFENPLPGLSMPELDEDALIKEQNMKKWNRYLKTTKQLIWIVVSLIFLVVVITKLDEMNLILERLQKAEVRLPGLGRPEDGIKPIFREIPNYKLRVNKVSLLSDKSISKPN